MDFIFSSQEIEEEDNHQPSNISDTGRETISTDHDRPPVKKTKGIRKQYEPIRDGNIQLRYEDDPNQYKKLRKKLQNRESAARVRGRKRGQFDGLEKEVQHLKKVNSELMLKNASLETENKSLKQQVQFFRSFVRPNENIDQYLNLDGSNKMKDEYHFQDEEKWIRSASSSPVRSQWSTLFVFTIIVGIFVIPASQSGDSVNVANQMEISQVSGGQMDFWSMGRTGLKYLIIIGYLIFALRLLYTGVNWKKLKKI